MINIDGRKFLFSRWRTLPNVIALRGARALDQKAIVFAIITPEAPCRPGPGSARRFFVLYASVRRLGAQPAAWAISERGERGGDCTRDAHAEGWASATSAAHEDERSSRSHFAGSVAGDVKRL
jgi:hypothetical protein